MKKNYFLKNPNAVIGFPVFLIVALIAASIVIGFFILSMFNMIQDSQTYIVRKELEKIVSEAENMFQYADSGTIVTIHINIPDSLRFIVFGSMPINDTAEPQDLTLNENLCNNYYFVMRDGTIVSESSNARFCSSDIDKVAILKQGSYDVTLELINVGDKSYVSIY